MLHGLHGTLGITLKRFHDHRVTGDGFAYDVFCGFSNLDLVHLVDIGHSMGHEMSYKMGHGDR